MITILEPRSRPSLDRMLARLAWAVAAMGVGLVLSTQSLAAVVGILGLTTAAVIALVTPTVALIIMLVLAPLRTLIATEARYPLPLDIGQLGLIAALAAWLAYRVSRRERLLHLTWSPVYVPVMGFFVAASLSIVNALSLGAWLSEWLKWAQVLVLSAVVLHVGRGSRWQWLVFGLALAGAANALVGIYEFFGGSGALHLLINNQYFRAFGTFGQPNPFGGFMGLLAPLAISAFAGYGAQWWRARRTNPRHALRVLIPVGFYALASGLMSVGLVMSWSRGAWLGFAVALAVMIFALPRRPMHSIALLGGVLTLVGGLWATGRLPASVVQRVNSATQELFAFDDVRGVDITPENYAVVERLAHWQAALSMARSHPFLGIGMGNYEAAYPAYRLANWKFPLGHAHNYYLNVFAEAGMIGLVGYTALWISVILLTWRARNHPDDLARFVVIGLLGTWTYLSVHSVTDNLYVNNIFLHIGVMLGILALLVNQTRADVHLELA